MKPAVGAIYHNRSLNEEGKVVGGGPPGKHWKFQWLQTFYEQEDGGPLKKERRYGSTTQVRVDGVPEYEGGWSPFGDESMWERK